MVEVHHEKIVLAAGFDLPLPSFQPSIPDVRAMHLGLKRNILLKSSCMHSAHNGPYQAR